jgi:hypothetical protein
LPGAFAEIAENYQNMSSERHLADGWRVAVPYVDEPGYRHDLAQSTVMIGPEFATEMPGALINIADEQAAQDAANAAALAEADAKWKAEEDKRIMALPSIAAIVADNAALRQKLAAAEVQLATVKATADKAAADVATLKAAKPVEPVK